MSKRQEKMEMYANLLTESAARDLPDIKKAAEQRLLIRELVDMLKIAREYIAWCRKHHADGQHGDGMPKPIEVIIDATIAKAAEGRQ